MEKVKAFACRESFSFELPNQLGKHKKIFETKFMTFGMPYVV